MHVEYIKCLDFDDTLLHNGAAMLSCAVRCLSLLSVCDPIIIIIITRTQSRSSLQDFKTGCVNQVVSTTRKQSTRSNTVGELSLTYARPAANG